MESSSIFKTADNGARVEVSTFMFEGKPFTALGSVVDHENGIVIGYPEKGVLQTCDGKPIGTCRVVSKYRMPRSWIGSWMYCYRATVDGEQYHGRGFGNGMLLRLRRFKPSKKNRLAIGVKRILDQVMKGT